MADAKQIEDKTAEKVDELAGSEAPLLEHLVELRKRLIYSAVTIVALMAFCFIFASTIYDWLLIPYKNSVPGANLIFTAPQELFFTYLNVALFYKGRFEDLRDEDGGRLKQGQDVLRKMGIEDVLEIQ